MTTLKLGDYRAEIHYGVAHDGRVDDYDDQEQAEEHAREYGGRPVRRAVFVGPWEEIK